MSVKNRNNCGIYQKWEVGNSFLSKITYYLSKGTDSGEKLPYLKLLVSVVGKSPKQNKVTSPT